MKMKYMETETDHMILLTLFIDGLVQVTPVH